MNKYVQPRPYSDPDAAARKLVEIANGPEPYMDSRFRAAAKQWRCLARK